MPDRTERRGRFLALVLPCCWLALSSCSNPEPAPPSTDLFLMDLRVEGETITVGDPVNLTRREGYDNQPYFLPGGEVLLYVSRDGENSDVFEYDLARRRSKRLTHTTLESEYSPQAVPGTPALSVVRVERGGDQRLLRLERDGGNPTLVTDLIQEPVGYYAWADENVFVAFLVAEPPQLVLVDLERGVAEPVAGDVGRSMHRIPATRSISFVHKESPSDWWIKQLDVDTGEVHRLVRTVQGREDHAWTFGGLVIMGSGSELFVARPGPGAGWDLVADLGPAGLREISRIAVSPRGDRIVVVAESGDR